MELRRVAKKDKRIKLNYYGVTTNDRGHLYTLYQNIKTAVNMNAQYSEYDSVNVVLNCQSESDFAEDTDILNVKKSLLNEIKDTDKKPAIFMNEYQEEYRGFCRRQEIHDFTYSFKKIEW